MGIYDRDYARAAPGAHRGIDWRRRVRALTFVQWLIMLNVAVFVTDGLLGARGVAVAVHMGDYYRHGLDPTKIQAVTPVLPKGARPAAGQGVQLPIIDAVSKEVVGQRVYRWMKPIEAYGHFSTLKAFFSLEVWRFITFQFLHADLSHLVLNMIALFFFGPLVEGSLRTRKRFAAFYLVCGIFGAVLYLALNTIGYLVSARIPGLLFDDMSTPLIGASAGVFAVLMASAKLAGDAEMLVFMVLPMKVRVGAYLMFALALLNLLRGGANAGGDAAHVGGAIAGFFFIRNMHYLKDFFEVFGPAGKPGVRRAFRLRSPRVDQSRVDDILAKVREHGLHSLTDAEQSTLRQATEEQRNGAS
jgi:membrane associated rhomboid family serine protease